MVAQGAGDGGRHMTDVSLLDDIGDGVLGTALNFSAAYCLVALMLLRLMRCAFSFALFLCPELATTSTCAHAMSLWRVMIGLPLLFCFVSLRVLLLFV
jgi:hypothetical protein